jgi:hypothetical protein
MNDDFYYLKYLKYKKKYLDEKNKIKGGGCDSNLANKLQQIDILQYFDEIINLIQSGSIESIIKFVKDRYIKDVFTYFKLDKDCLASQLLNYMQEKQQLLAQKKILQVILSKGKSFPNLTFTSLNIREEPEGSFKEEIVQDNKFSKGTAFIVKNVEKKNFFTRVSYDKLERNLRYLTNIMNVKFAIESNVFIESLRFGTPYAPKGADNFYKTQVNILKNYVGNKICLFISFLDICVSSLCKLNIKIAEQKTVEEELNGYNVNNFIYLNLPCNNGVNLTGAIAGISDPKLKKIINDNLTKLEKLMNIPESKNPILHKVLVKLKDNFFEKLKKYVTDKDNYEPYLLQELKIRKFVIREIPKLETEFKNFDDYMKKFSPCEEDLTNEHIGLVMFCYLSLIFYILSKSEQNKYILLYHCKSGQDRTGTFFAINQMVNEITTKNYDNIVKKIINGSSFIDIFFEFYSLTKKNINIPQEKKNCPNDPKTLLLATTEESRINKDVELCYLRYLLFTYLMTITSTGVPGIKWGLTNNQILMRPFNNRKYDTKDAIDNRFGYLCLRVPNTVNAFEGASKMRGGG